LSSENWYFGGDQLPTPFTRPPATLGI